MNVARPRSTLSFPDTIERNWDVVVIGAGPEAALAARSHWEGRGRCIAAMSAVERDTSTPMKLTRGI